MSRAMFHTLGSGWTPLWLGSSLLAWFDPDFGVTKDGGTNRVSAWAARYGGYSWAQDTGGAQPLWTATGVNSRPAFYFDGNRCLRATLGSSSDELLQLSQAASAGWFGIIKADVAAASDTLLGVPPGTTTTFWLKLTPYVQATRTTSTGHFFTPSVSPGTNTTLLGGTIESGTLYGHANEYKSAGAAVDTGTPEKVGVDMVLGQRRTATVDSDNLVGYVGDLVFLRTAPTAQQKTDLLRWARAKWGIL